MEWLWSPSDSLNICFCGTWRCKTYNSVPIILVLLTNKNVALIYYVTICEKRTKDCAPSGSFQHNLQHHCFQLWYLPGFLTSSSAMVRLSTRDASKSSPNYHLYPYYMCSVWRPGCTGWHFPGKYNARTGCRDIVFEFLSDSTTCCGRPNLVNRKENKQSRINFSALFYMGTFLHYEVKDFTDWICYVYLSLLQAQSG